MFRFPVNLKTLKRTLRIKDIKMPQLCGWNICSSTALTRCGMQLKCVQQHGFNTLWSVLCCSNRWNHTTWRLIRITADSGTCYQTPVPGSPFPVLRSPFPVISFINILKCIEHVSSVISACSLRSKYDLHAFCFWIASSFAKLHW